MPRKRAGNRRTSKERMEPEPFFEMINSYPDPAGISLYINRIFPPILRKPAYIDKQNAKTPFYKVPEDVRDRWGGGEYIAYLTDSNLPDDKREVAHCILEWDWSKWEPVLNPRELVRGTEKAEQFIQNWIAKGKIRLDKDGLIEPVNTNSDNEGTTRAALEFAKEVIDNRTADKPDPAINKSIELMANTSQKVVEHALSQVKPGDPLAMIQAIAAIIPKPDSGATTAAIIAPMMTLVTTLLQQQQALTLQLIQMKNPQTPAAPAGAEALHSTFQMFKEFRKLMGDAPGSNGGGWMAVLDKLGDKIPDLFTAYMGIKAASSIQPGGSMPGFPLPGEAPAGQVPSPGGSGTPPGGTGAGTPAQHPQVNAALDVQQLYQVAHLALNSMNKGSTGDNLARSIEELYGMNFYQKICSYKLDGIMEAVRIVPQLWAKVQPIEPQFRTFVEEFLTAFDDDEEETAPDGNPHQQQSTATA